MKRSTFLVTLVSGAMASTVAWALGPSPGKPGQAKSACGCVDCRCPDCDGETCRCDACECASCGCAG